MLDAIQTKTCSKCKQIKQVSEYFRDRSHKDGLANWCKICRGCDSSRYKKTPKAKKRRKELAQRAESKRKQAAWQRKYYQTPTRQHWEKQYRHNPKRKAVVKRYSQSSKGKFRVKRYRYNNPDPIKARTAVDTAVRRGNLPRAKTLRCSYCGNQAKQYHHYLGYAQDHWIDVIPLCKMCHKVAHQKERIA